MVHRTRAASLAVSPIALLSSAYCYTIFLFSNAIALSSAAAQLATTSDQLCAWHGTGCFQSRPVLAQENELQRYSGVLIHPSQYGAVCPHQCTTVSLLVSVTVLCDPRHSRCVTSRDWHHDIGYAVEFMNQNRTVQEKWQYCLLLYGLQQNLLQV